MSGLPSAMDLALAELQRPAGVRILLRRWGGFVWPDLVRLDCILFSLGVALFGCRCQRCVDDVAALAQLTVEIGEQYFQRDGCWAESAPSMALMTSLTVSWLGNTCLKRQGASVGASWCIWPQRLISQHLRRLAQVFQRGEVVDQR